MSYHWLCLEVSAFRFYRILFYITVKTDTYVHSS